MCECLKQLCQQEHLDGVNHTEHKHHFKTTAHTHNRECMHTSFLLHLQGHVHAGLALHQLLVTSAMTYPASCQGLFSEWQVPNNNNKCYLFSMLTNTCFSIGSQLGFLKQNNCKQAIMLIFSMCNFPPHQVQCLHPSRHLRVQHLPCDVYICSRYLC